MTAPSTTSHRARQGRFLRIVVMVWGGLLVALLTVTALAPYAGRIIDVVLHQTLYRDWKRVVLDAGHLVKDRSTPLTTLQNYYSMLYWGEPHHLEDLTGGAFRLQVQARLRAGEVTAGTDTPRYRSYLLLESQGAQHAVVLEKFHLFWQHGLRFRVQRMEAGWVITQVEPVP